MVDRGVRTKDGSARASGVRVVSGAGRLAECEALRRCHLACAKAAAWFSQSAWDFDETVSNIPS